MKLLLILAGIALCIYGDSSLLRGETTADVSAAVQFSNGDTITITDFSDQIGVQPNEMVDVTIQFPPNAAGLPVVVEAVDGGITSVGSSIPVVNQDGTLGFAFVAPKELGNKVLAIRVGSVIARLQFSVADASRP